jgi:hypothetical protein
MDDDRKTFRGKTEARWDMEVNSFSWTDNHVKRVLAQRLRPAKNVPAKINLQGSIHCKNVLSRFRTSSERCMEKDLSFGRFPTCTVEETRF